MSDIKFALKHIAMPSDSDGEEVQSFIPLSGDEADKDLPVDEVLPVLALRNAILFPGAVMPVAIGRRKSLTLVRNMEKHSKEFVAATQVDSDVEDPSVSDLNPIGTVARVVKMLEMPDGSTTAILQGRTRVHLEEEVQQKPFITARVTKQADIPIAKSEKKEFDAMISTIKETAARIFRISGNVGPEAVFAVKNIEPSPFLINFIASNSDFKIEDKIEIINEDNIFQRALLLLKYLTQEEQFITLKNDIQTKVRQGLDQQQREYMLQQQIRTIQDELGDNPIDQQIEEFKSAATHKKWSKSVAETFEKELTKLSRLNPSSPDYSIQATYIDNMLKLPWNKKTTDNYDLARAEKVLDADHYGLDKVKTRILEHLAVLKLTGNMKSPILCLYGPPGVGKTSLGQSIAKALGRKYVRVSLGGLHDEAEIRGHRRTYIGAMMGRILQNISKADSSNPVFILDEIDKIGNDFHGDPSSALLEVLDPEQNSAFHDNYLDIDYDLSNVMFIATANNISNVSLPLLDRMELIDVSGYLLEEKVEIAARHLLPKQMKSHGLKRTIMTVPNETLAYIIEKYTRESGVRELDKTLASLCRKVALTVARGEHIHKKVTPEDVRKYLGIEKYSHDIWQDNMKPGVVTGLAWTAVGGEILFIEANTSKGKGKLTLTGNLGDVMKESAILAVEYIRSNASLWGLEGVNFDEENIHVHVPEGAVPKDGPSAGITMVTSVLSALTQRPVKKRIAMTGEITLRGKVLPVGGSKEKILAAKRAGITDIILSSQNQKDISEIKEIYIEGLSFHYVEEIPEVIELALEKATATEAKPVE